MEKISKDINKTICSYLWSSLCVRTNGRLVPCCIYDDMAPAPHLSEYNNDIESTYNSALYTEMRDKVLKGEPVKGCESCYFREKETGKSLRLKANDEWSEAFNSNISPLKNVTYLEIFVGNKCNLKCLMCSPSLSSALASDYVKLGMASEEKIKPFENDYREMVSKLESLNKLKFVGGEPLMNSAHWELLESIPAERAQKITLEYATNCTFFPNEEQIKLWEKFKSLEIFLSIDGFEKVNEYIRYPSKWNKVEENAKKFKSLIDANSKSVFGINSVVSNYNIFKLDELTDWAYQNLGDFLDNSGHTTFFLSCLTYPDYLNIKNLPVSVKKQLLEKYPDEPHYSFVRSFLQSEGNEDSLKELIHMTTKFDSLRKIDYKEYIPSIEPIIHLNGR